MVILAHITPYTTYELINNVVICVTVVHSLRASYTQSRNIPTGHQTIAEMFTDVGSITYKRDNKVVTVRRTSRKKPSTNRNVISFKYYINYSGVLYLSVYWFVIVFTRLKTGILILDVKVLCCGIMRVYFC